jgi:PBP1b-binding outer membrane lipoprotein LpoB
MIFEEGDSMKKLYIILGIVSILLFSGCLDNTKTDVSVNGDDTNVSVDANNTANNSTGSENTYPVGSNITEDGTEVVS